MKQIISLFILKETISEYIRNSLIIILGSFKEISENHSFLYIFDIFLKN